MFEYLLRSEKTVGHCSHSLSSSRYFRILSLLSIEAKTAIALFIPDQVRARGGIDYRRAGMRMTVALSCSVRAPRADGDRRLERFMWSQYPTAVPVQFDTTSDGVTPVRTRWYCPVRQSRGPGWRVSQPDPANQSRSS